MIIKVKGGKLQGIQKRSILTGLTFYAFLGIPYARPPIGNLRFQAPVPIEGWNGVLNASKEGSVCFQENMFSDKKEIIGSEDCLYANVYTPESPAETKNKKAVMVFIHGGGFLVGSGSATLYGPDFLISHDIVYVTFNYRLNIFGFLNTNTWNCRGNAGMKDQLLALKWIKDNIDSFGGDPEKITIFGESAGATSVHLHMLSPLSKGLFSRAILQSGNAFVPWAFDRDPASQARKIGLLAEYREDNMEGLVEHLKKLPGSKLCELASRCHEDTKRNSPGLCSTFVFVPSAEKFTDGAFLPDVPEKMIESATPIPSITGITDQEGLLFFPTHTPDSMDFLLNNPSMIVRNNFHLDECKTIELTEKMRNFYFKHETNRGRTAQFVDLYTDLYFMKFYQAIDYLVQSEVPPYIYLFAHDGKLNMFKNLIKALVDLENITGASHGDDLGYLFSQSVVTVETDEADRKVIDYMCTLWTNFAKTGQPTSSLPQIDWKPYRPSQPSYLRMEETLKVFHEKLFDARLGFWKNWSANF